MGACGKLFVSTESVSVMQYLISLVVLCSFVTALQAENWPGWRGPTGQGFSAEEAAPVKWDKTENVRWKAPLPDAGNSTPIIWGNKIFLTQASDRKLWPPQKPENFPKGVSSGGAAILEKRSVLCFNRADGELLWQRDTIYPEPESTHPTNPFCSASPVTDGERVIASHGSAGLVCYDLDGKELWKYDVGKLEHVWGNASSPVIWGDLCIHWCGPGERQFLVAVNKKTGAKVWQVDEPDGDSGLTSGRFVGSWCSPLIAKVGDREQLIFSVPGRLTGYDPATGEVLWTSGRTSKTGYSYPSPLFVDGLAIYNGTLVKLGGSGDITKDQLNYKLGSMYITSAVIAGDYYYTLNNVGVPACYEWKTGSELWKDQISERPGGTTAWGSLVYAAGRIYITDQRGSTLVFAAGPKYEHLATNKLDEATNASLAISDGDIFIRTHKHLWCISERK